MGTSPKKNLGNLSMSSSTSPVSGLVTLTDFEISTYSGAEYLGQEDSTPPQKLQHSKAEETKEYMSANLWQHIRTSESEFQGEKWGSRGVRT